MSTKKRPLIAGVLNFVVPGLGLLYLGFKKAALINFSLVNVVLVVCSLADPKLLEHVHYLFLGLAALSAGYAHGVANTQLKNDGADDKKLAAASRLDS